MNYERLKELRKHIAKSRRFDYAVFVAPKNYKNENYCYADSLHPAVPATLNEKRCGTVGCVAGHAVALLGGPRQQKMGNVFSTAKRILNLTEPDAYFLFYGGSGYGLAEVENLETATKKDALKRLDVLIATQKAK